MEAPSAQLVSAPLYFLLLGWTICILGWLFVPLLVGALLDASFQRLESERKFRMIFEQVGISMGLTGPQLKRFVDGMLQKKDEIIGEQLRAQEKKVT